MSFFKTCINTTLGVTLFLLVLLAALVAYKYYTPVPQPNPDIWASGTKIKSTEGLSWSTINGLNVITTGNPSGPLLVLLHGFPETGLLSWHHQLEYFSKQNRYFVVCPDMRGYNTSMRPEGVANYRLDVLASDIVGLIDHFGRASAYLAGHDWGAAVSWWVAIKYPNKINKLVILNTPHPCAMQTYLPTHPSQLHKSWYILYFQLPTIAENYFRKDNFAWPMSTLASALPKTFAIDEVKKYQEVWSSPGAVESMLAYYRATIQFSFADEGQTMQKIIKEHLKVQPPTLILWGKNDDYLEAPLADLSADFCQEGGVKYLNASHWLQHELPNEVAKQLDDFFSEK